MPDTAAPPLVLKLGDLSQPAALERRAWKPPSGALVSLVRDPLAQGRASSIIAQPTERELARRADIARRVAAMNRAAAERSRKIQNLLAAQTTSPPRAIAPTLGAPIIGGKHMPKLSSIVAEEATANVPIGSGKVRVDFRPALITPELQEGIFSAESTGNVKAGLYGPLSDLLIGWDLTDDDDQPLPTTPESLRGVPILVLAHVFRGMLQSLLPATPPPGPRR